MLQNLRRISLICQFSQKNIFVSVVFLPTPHFQARVVLMNKSKTLIWLDTLCRAGCQLSEKTYVPPVGGLLKGIKLYNHQAKTG